MFSRSSVRYGKTPEPQTPYQRAGQVWDARIGSARLQAKNWRLAFFLMLAMSMGLAFGLIWQSTRGTITPWVVEVDKLGEARAVAPAISDWRPSDLQIGWFLAYFIKCVRSISVDPPIMRENWLDAYNYVTAKGALALNDYARRANPFEKIGKEQVSVDVSSVIRASDNSFRVAWVEHHYVDGALALSQRWSAIFTVIVQAPRDRDTLIKNPLGLYIDALNWSKELN